MDPFRVLVIHELRYYREVISSAVRKLRPNIEVTTADPKLLDQDLICFDSDLVVCSRATPAIQIRYSAWIELYPNGEPRAVACINGHRSTVNEIDLDGLLSIIDEAEKEKHKNFGQLRARPDS